MGLLPGRLNRAQQKRRGRARTEASLDIIGDLRDHLHRGPDFGVDADYEAGFNIIAIFPIIKKVNGKLSAFSKNYTVCRAVSFSLH